MLIISKFHDYYDSAMGMGIDKTVVYNRTVKDDREERRYHRYQLHSKKKSWHVNIFIVGFCGELYPCIKLTEDLIHNPKSFFFYELNKLETFIVEEEISIDVKRRWRGIVSIPHARMNNTYARQDWFDLKTHTDKKLDSKFEQEKCPVFMWTKRGMVWNPNLKDIGFQKVIDPYTAFQEVYMYISGVLGTNENEMVTISDEDKLHKKGFFEWSFKKLPGGKKRNKGRR